MSPRQDRLCDPSDWLNVEERSVCAPQSSQQAAPCPSTQHPAPCPSYPAFVVALPRADLSAFHLSIDLPPFQAGHSGNRGLRMHSGGVI